VACVVVHPSNGERDVTFPFLIVPLKNLCRQVSCLKRHAARVGHHDSLPWPRPTVLPKKKETHTPPLLFGITAAQQRQRTKRYGRAVLPFRGGKHIVFLLGEPLTLAPAAGPARYSTHRPHGKPITR
jgi:hypothetical protein